MALSTVMQKNPYAVTPAKKAVTTTPSGGSYLSVPLAPMPRVIPPATPNAYGAVPGAVAPGSWPNSPGASTSTPLSGGNTAAAPAAPGQTTDERVSADPLYRRALAAQTATDANAEAQALAQRKQRLVDYGATPEQIAAILGTPDTNTAAAAANNPYSTVQLLAKAYADMQKNTDQTMNQGNLFFSGARVGQMGKDADTYGKNQYTASGTLQGLLDAITTALNTTKGTAQTAADQAYTEAFTRAINSATA
jgi:hypothetical protein